MLTPNFSGTLIGKIKSDRHLRLPSCNGDISKNRNLFMDYFFEWLLRYFCIVNVSKVSPVVGSCNWFVLF